MALNDQVNRKGLAYTVRFQSDVPDVASGGTWLNTLQLLQCKFNPDLWAFVDNVWFEFDGTKAECLTALHDYLDRNLEAN